MLSVIVHLQQLITKLSVDKYLNYHLLVYTWSGVYRSGWGRPAIFILNPLSPGVLLASVSDGSRLHISWLLHNPVTMNKQKVSTSSIQALVIPDMLGNFVVL